MAKSSFESQVPSHVRKELEFSDEPVLGLLIDEVDLTSWGKPIEADKYYWVGKNHKEKWIGVFPADGDSHNNELNNLLKRRGQLN